MTATKAIARMSIAAPVAVQPIKIGNAPLTAPTAVFSGDRDFIGV
jgi:hypothetical protein